MYSVDASGAQLLLGYKDVFFDEMPDLEKGIKDINVHKAISIICELIRVSDAKINAIRTLGVEISIPFETVLKKQMCGIHPESAEEMLSNPLLRKDVHIISVQMLLILLKKIIQHGKYETINETDYEVTEDDYRQIIKLQLVVAEQLNHKYSQEFDTDHFLYSNYHFNYKKNTAYEFLRMYYMLEIISRDKKNFDDIVQREYRDYYSVFTKKYGFTPTQYSSLLFRELKTYYTDINGLLYNKMWENIREANQNTKDKDLALKVISTLSQTINNYKEWAETSEYQEWDFSKFYEYPFIKDLKGNYISISDVSLRNAFFEKIFWLIRYCYPKTDKSAMAFFGRLFERYIQDLTEDAAKLEYVYIEEFSYEANKKSSDAYIRKDTDLLVVEAKGFSVLLDCMIKNERIEDNNKKLFIDPVLQADNCLSEVIGRKPEFAGVEDAFIISVTLDNVNAVPNYYDAIHTSIKEGKVSKNSKYFFNFNIEEYEMLMFLVEQNIDIFILLKDYFENTTLKPFANYLQEKHTTIGMTSFMEKYYNEASKNMKEMYFPE